MEDTHETPPTLFDAENGKLIIGSAAIEAATAGQMMGDYSYDTPPEDSDRKAGTYSMPELLTTDNFPFDKQSFSRGNAGTSPEDLVAYAAWAGKLLGNEQTVYEHHLDRLNTLRIGPSLPIYFHKVGRMWEIRQAAGLKASTSHNAFIKWTIEDFATHAEKITAELGGRRPTKEDYDAAAKADPTNPSAKQITERIGLGELGGMIGFFDARNSDDVDILLWGVQVAENNGIVDLSKKIVSYLSSAGVGPTDKTIQKYFGSLPEFSRQVAAQVAENQARCQAERQAKLDELERLARHDNEIDQYSSGLSDVEKIGFLAKYNVAKRLLATTGVSIARLASLTVGRFVRAIIDPRLNDRPTAGDVEVTAVELGVYDDIWKPKDYDFRLKLPGSLLPKPQPPRPPQPGTGEQPAQSIEDVRAAIQVAIEKATESVGVLQQATEHLETARHMFAHCAEGSYANQGVTEVQAYYGEAANQLADVMKTSMAAVESMNDVTRRL